METVKLKIKITKKFLKVSGWVQQQKRREKNQWPWRQQKEINDENKQKRTLGSCGYNSISNIDMIGVPEEKRVGLKTCSKI